MVEKPATLARLRQDISSGSVKAADLAAAYYDRIAAINGQLNIYLSLTKERALEQASGSMPLRPRAIRCLHWRASLSASRTCW